MEYLNKKGAQNSLMGMILGFIALLLLVTFWILGAIKNHKTIPPQGTLKPNNSPETNKITPKVQPILIRNKKEAAENRFFMS